jgi:rhodanese-related sulfurtransferase
MPLSCLDRSNCAKSRPIDLLELGPASGTNRIPSLLEETPMKLLSRWFRRPPTRPTWIEPMTLATRLERSDAPPLILDVRGPDEFSGPLGHIRGATNTPLAELSAHLPDLLQTGRPIIVVCKTDRRSSLAAQQLRDAGLSDVTVLRGGMEQWRELGLPAD